MAYPDNRFYGHKYVLAEYAGHSGSDEPLVFGAIQHGWSWTTPMPDRVRVLRSVPFLAWSKDHERLLRAQGIKRVVAIGAPMVYLDRLRGSAGATCTTSRRTLVYPAHGWERQAMRGSIERFTAAVKDRAAGDVTICLYFTEYRDRATRHAYEAQGFEVVCHGVRSDPTFLWRQYDEIARHDEVLSNNVSSALWYAGLQRKGVALVGEPFTFGDTWLSDRYRRFQRARWPELIDGVAGPEAREIALAELGGNMAREPDELAALVRLGEHAPRAARSRTAFVRGEYQARRAFAVARAKVRPRALAVPPEVGSVDPVIR